MCLGFVLVDVHVYVCTCFILLTHLTMCTFAFVCQCAVIMYVCVGKTVNNSHQPTSDRKAKEALLWKAFIQLDTVCK